MYVVTIAFILINLDLGKGAVLTEALKKIPEVKELYHVYGIYDYVVRIETENIEQMREIVQTKIRNLDHIKSTLAMVVVE